MVSERPVQSKLELVSERLVQSKLEMVSKRPVQSMFVCLMVFKATFSNISVVSWRSVLFGENRRLLQVTDKLYHIMLYTSPWSGFELETSMMIGTDCIGSCKSNYHTITATTTPYKMMITMYITSFLVNFSSIHQSGTTPRTQKTAQKFKEGRCELLCGYLWHYC